MADMVTRCPQCGTSFRITQAQVKAAKGAVRCGSCLQIFKALDNLSEPRRPGTDKQQGQVEKSTIQKAAATHPTSHKNSPQRTEKQQTVAQRTDIKSPPPDARATTGSGSSDDNLLAKPTKVTNIAQPKATGALSTNKPAHPPTKDRLDFDQAAIDSESEMLISDDMYDEDLDDDDLLISDDMDDVQDSNEVNSAYKKSDSSSSVFSDSFLKLDHWQSEQKTLFDREIKVNDSEEKDTADESWAVSLLEELEEEEAVATEKASQIKPESADNNEPPDELKDEGPEENFATFDDKNTSIAEGDDEDDDEGDDGDEKANVAAFNTEENLEEFEHDKAELYTRGRYQKALLTSIEPAPVEMHARRDRLKRSWLWQLLTVITALVLVMQIAIFQFDRFSRIAPYRSWYGSICDIVGCQLPEIIDYNKIRAYNLVIRSHPRADNALVVDTILLNTAPFKQPFPNLQLSFSDLNGNLQSAREFAPSEYLGGEMVGQTHMPSGQPIHLSLEIVDPGREAVNYSIAISK